MKARLNRQWAFICYMFPLQIYVPACVVSYLAIYFMLQAMSQIEPVIFTSRALGGGICAVLLPFLMRLYDELKDVDNDLRLGNAGDPRYKDRPIVTGAVKIEDIAALRWWVSGLLIVINLFMGNIVLATFACVFIFMWCSFKWFFYPPISESIILAFLTHNPITPAIGLYFVSIFAADFGLNTLSIYALTILLFGWWMPVAAWEISRKIRLPEDETDYQTYSIVLGWKNAVRLTIFFLTIAVICLTYLTTEYHIHYGYLGVLYLASLLFLIQCVSLLIKPTSEKTKLQRPTETVIVAVNLGLIITIIASYGIQFQM